MVMSSLLCVGSTKDLRLDIVCLECEPAYIDNYPSNQMLYSDKLFQIVPACHKLKPLGTRESLTFKHLPKMYSMVRRLLDNFC
jgi:hypothetical protein